MRVEQRRWSEAGGWGACVPGELRAAQLVLLFGEPSLLTRGDLFEQVRGAYPDAELLSCSTAGEISGIEVTDDSLVSTAIQFEHTRVAAACAPIESAECSFAVGERLAKELSRDGLVHMLVLSEGLTVNGSELVNGLCSHMPSGSMLSGGLSGDGDRFERTCVGLNQPARPGTVAAVGFYGDRLRVGCGSLGGWDPFGPERLITRSDGNILYELDGKPALALYKRYLAEHAEDLPASGLLFPLSLRGTDDDHRLVRTILAVDDDAQTMTFAGDVPEGSYAQLMKANFDRLVEGALDAARTSHVALAGSDPELAILISCVGRKLVLKQRTEEELEAVQSVLGERVALTGFYSYGEIAPFAPGAGCELHNQTMTITTMSER